MCPLPSKPVVVPAGILSADEQLTFAVAPSRAYYYVRAGIGSFLLFVLAAMAPRIAVELLRALFPELFSRGVPGDMQAWAVIIGLVMAALWWLPTIGRTFSIYILTSQRLIKRTGILATQTRYTPLARVQDLAVTQSLFQRLMHCGDIRISSAGAGHNDMIWSCVDGPYALADAIRQHLPSAGQAM